LVLLLSYYLVTVALTAYNYRPPKQKSDFKSL
jgi:hypothetical protein